MLTFTFPLPLWRVEGLKGGPSRKQETRTIGKGNTERYGKFSTNREANVFFCKKIYFFTKFVHLFLPLQASSPLCQTPLPLDDCGRRVKQLQAILKKMWVCFVPLGQVGNLGACGMPSSCFFCYVLLATGAIQFFCFPRLPVIPMEKDGKCALSLSGRLVGSCRSTSRQWTLQGCYRNHCTSFGARRLIKL